MSTVQKIATSDKCTGCGACQASCPTSCIELREDEEGFARPVIDFDRCIECGRCKRACHVCSHVDLNSILDARLVAANSKRLYGNGASGGLFGVIAEAHMRKGAHIFGARFEDDFSLNHREVGNLGEVKQFQGSKYVQSDMSSVFECIKNQLTQGEKVVFSGTPCQVAALRSYLGGECVERLATIDLICHGVPSPGFWRKEVSYLSTRMSDGVLRSVLFRNETKYDRYGYAFFLTGEDGSMRIPWQKDVYYRLFMESASLRECCYSCPYATSERVSDLTIGDCGSIDKYSFFDDVGIGTLTLANTEKGRKLLEEIEGEVSGIKIDLLLEIKANKQLHEPAQRPDIRNSVYSDLEEMTYGEFRHKYARNEETGIAERAKKALRRVVSWRTITKAKRVIKAK